MNRGSEREPPCRHGDQNAKRCRGEGDGGKHEAPGEAAEVTGALRRRAHQHVHGGKEQAQEVERQGEQGGEHRKVHCRGAAEGFGHRQQ